MWAGFLKTPGGGLTHPAQCGTRGGMGSPKAFSKKKKFASRQNPYLGLGCGTAATKATEVFKMNNYIPWSRCDDDLWGGGQDPESQLREKVTPFFSRHPVRNDDLGAFAGFVDLGICQVQPPSPPSWRAGPQHRRKPCSLVKFADFTEFCFIRGSIPSTGHEPKFVFLDTVGGGQNPPTHPCLGLCAENRIEENSPSRRHPGFQLR